MVNKGFQSNKCFTLYLKLSGRELQRLLTPLPISQVTSDRLELILY